MRLRSDHIRLIGVRRGLVILLLLASCGQKERAPEPAPIAHDAAVAPDAAPPDAAPVVMLAPERDPWSPNGPRPPERPEPTGPLPPKAARDAPEPADRPIVIDWNDRPAVRAHIAIGNWDEARPLFSSGESLHDGLTFHPSWNQANIDLDLEITCQGSCETSRLARNIAQHAQREFAMTQSADRKPRWIVKPQLSAGVWHFRYETTDKRGSYQEGRVAIMRIVPALGAILECTGSVTNRGNPIWLDRIEKLCRELTFELVQSE